MHITNSFSREVPALLLMLGDKLDDLLSSFQDLFCIILSQKRLGHYALLFLPASESMCAHVFIALTGSQNNIGCKEQNSSVLVTSPCSFL